MKDIIFVFLLNGNEIDMRMKENPYAIEDCEKGKFVHLFLKNGEEYQGYFNGMGGDEIILKSTKSSLSIGISFLMVKQYLEQI